MVTIQFREKDFFLCYLNSFAYALNTGEPIAKGRTSGGVDGYANLEVRLTAQNYTGNTSDRFTATVWSDVSTVEYAYLRVTAWYIDDASGESSVSAEGEFTLLAPQPYTYSQVTAVAGNAYGYKGTSGFSARFATRGTFVCGTTVTI